MGISFRDLNRRRIADRPKPHGAAERSRKVRGINGGTRETGGNRSSARTGLEREDRRDSVKVTRQVPSFLMFSAKPNREGTHAVIPCYQTFTAWGRLRKPRLAR